MMKVSKFVCLATFLGIATTDWATCCTRPHSDSQETATAPFMSLTIPVSAISLTKKMPQKVDSFRAVTLQGSFPEGAPVDDIITQICARVNCDNIASLALEECDWQVVDKILPHFTKLEKLIIIGHQEQDPSETEKISIIHNACKLLTNCTLSELIIWNANINDSDAKMIFDKITPDNPLQILDFSWNYITEKDTQYVSDFIRRNTSLEILDLRGNEIDDEGALKMLEAKDYTLSEGIKIVLFENPIKGMSLCNYFGLDSVNASKEIEDTESENSSTKEIEDTKSETPSSEEDYFADTETAIENR